MRYLLLFGLLGLSACTTLSRSERSGYAQDETDATYQSGEPDIYQQRRSNVEEEAKEELGLGDRPLTEDEQAAVQTRVRLKQMEAGLETKREKKQYFSLRSELKSDRERIAFLSLPNYDARERWAQNRGLGQKDETYSDEVAKTIDSNDIALGMSQKAVTQAWGDPDAVETAGDPLYGYERWKYNRYVSGSEGYEKELRIVYFEGGHVVGWERN